jgi:hypothetical protein
MTSDQVHYGQIDQIHAARQITLDHAFEAYPERFVKRPPIPPAKPIAVWINPPKSKAQQKTQNKPKAGSKSLARSEAVVLLERDKPWYEARLPILDGRVRIRLDQLSDWLGETDWIDGQFSAADILMVTVLRRLESSGILNDYPNLSACIDRGKARAAYKRAFEAQLAVFTSTPSFGSCRPGIGRPRTADPDEAPNSASCG